MTKTTTRIAAIILAAGLGGALVGCTDMPESLPADPPITDELPGEQPNDPPMEEPGDDTVEGVSMDGAIDIAINEYGGTLVTVAADEHNGEATWNVSLTGTDDGDIDVEVSQTTGQIVAVNGE